MKLYYHNDINFGDALNPLLFNKLLPEVFNGDDQEIFLGIGTLIGWRELNEQTQKAYIFSSGYGYGPKPALDDRYEVLCVRGPLTARALNVPHDLSVSDGAILADCLVDIPQKKKYRCSYMPHHYSEEKYDGWGKICEHAGIHFISPTISPENSIKYVLKEVADSELVICEALHGAIIADTLRVPWIPVKAYKHINTFKWADYAASMEIKVEFNRAPGIFSDEFLRLKLADKLPVSLPGSFFDLLHKTGNAMLNHTIEQVAESLTQIQIDNRNYLSADSIMNDRKQKLLEILDGFRKGISIIS